jgi:1-acyl-sn-glycerol-3-phosphate acyltransferase
LNAVNLFMKAIAIDTHVRSVELTNLSNAPFKKNSPSDVRRVIYLCNHRSWADFFVDQAICGGASYLARLMVWVGTPVSSLYAWMSHSTWFFKRQRGIDRNAFAKFMEDEWTKRPTYGMVAYPEGTRNQAGEPLPLKTGVLQYAFEYKHPVQCVVTAGKEQVCNEKRLTMKRNRAVVTSCSELIDPTKFETMEAFVTKVRESFADTWKSAYTTKEEDAVPYNPPMGREPPTFQPVCEPYKLRTLRLATLCLVLLVLGGKWSRPPSSA